VTPGPQNGRRFGMAEGGQTTLTDIDDSSRGELPLAHVVDGAEKASHAFAGGPINANGNDYDGVPTLAEDAVARVRAEFAARAEKAPAESPAASAPKKADPDTKPKAKAAGDVPEKKAATPEASGEKKARPDPDGRAEVEVARAADTSGVAGKKSKSAGTAKKSAPATGDKAPEVAEQAPETLSQARGGKPDDLKMLKGVGPKLEATLNELGFYHFDQIAGWGPQEVAWVDSRLKFKGRIERDGWIDQAAILASGEDTDFSKRVEAGQVASSKSED
jgi:NADH-quinone oxidoreductase subunit E